MRDGLAWRWVGLHAAAFTLSSFCWAVQNNISSGATSEPWIHLFSAFFLGFPLAAAQELALLGRDFPGRFPLRFLATAAGVGLGSWAHFASMGAFIRATTPLRRIDVPGLGYAMVVGMLTTAGAVLGAAQALVLLRRVKGRILLIWGCAVTGAWVAAELPS